MSSYMAQIGLNVKNDSFKVKAKLTLKPVMQTEWGSRGMALLFFNLGARWGWTVYAHKNGLHGALPPSFSYACTKCVSTAPNLLSEMNLLTLLINKDGQDKNTTQTMDRECTRVGGRGTNVNFSLETSGLCDI
jgi:hypothetical protein